MTRGAVGARPSPRRALLEMRDNARLALANANVVRLALSWCAYVTAEAAYAVAILVIAYQGGGTGAVAVVGALRALPRAFVAPLGSALADRYPKAAVIASVQALRGGLMLCIAAVVALHGSVVVTDVLVVAISAVSSPFRPAVNALTAQLVDHPEELTSANSLYSFVEAAGTLVGPVLAAVLLDVAPSQFVFVSIAAILALAASATLGIRSEFRAPLGLRGGGWRATLEPLLGFAMLSRIPGVRTVLGLMATQAMMRGLLNVFVVVLAVTTLGLGQAGVGSLLAVVGAGGIVGALVSMNVIRLRGLAPAFAGGLSLWGIPFVVIGVLANRPIAFVALCALGLGNAVEDVSGLTLFQRAVPDHLLGRAFGALWATATLTMAIGSLIAAPLVSALGVQHAMIVSGAVLLLLLVSSLPSLRHVDRHVHVPARELSLLRGVSLFASLPLVSIERLARSLHHVDAHAGDDVVRQGEPGDRYYIVDRGLLRVTVDGTDAGVLGPGDGFGEIALLHQERRTATVHALDDSSLYWLDGHTFVLAVTGHAPTDRAAWGIAREHLDADRVRSGA